MSDAKPHPTGQTSTHSTPHKYFYAASRVKIVKTVGRNPELYDWRGLHPHLTVDRKDTRGYVEASPFSRGGAPSFAPPSFGKNVVKFTTRFVFATSFLIKRKSGVRTHVRATHYSANLQPLSRRINK